MRELVQCDLGHFAERLVAEEVIDLGERYPSARFEAFLPVFENRREVWEVSRREAAPNSVDSKGWEPRQVMV